MLCALRNIIRKHGGLPLAGTRREVAHMIMQRGVGNCNAGCTPALPLHVHVRLQLNTGAGRVTAPTVPALLTLFCFFHGLLMRKTFPIRLTDLWRLTIRSWFLIILQTQFSQTTWDFLNSVNNFPLRIFQLSLVTVWIYMGGVLIWPVSKTTHLTDFMSN